MDNTDITELRNNINLSGITLLIAEDDPTNFRLLAAMLKKSGANIEWAKDGKEAVDFVKSKPKEEKCLVLMDIKMPLIDGYEAKKQIAAIDDSIPVIAVTAYAQVQDKERILNSNFAGYVSKPIDIRELLKLLVQFV
jgi:CheY-like chemotaxis protein